MLSRPKKNLEDMNIEELKKELSKRNKMTKFRPKEYETDEDGALLLDRNDPNDRKWYENDEDYNVIK